MSELPFVNRFGHTTCTHCKKTYVKGEYYPCCSWECHHLENNERACDRDLVRNVCKGCGKEFKNFSKKRYCSEICSGRAIPKRKSDAEKASVENALWEKDNHCAARMRKSGKKGLPYNVLNRIEEKKRVMDEKGWDHFNRGRNWDRI